MTAKYQTLRRRVNHVMRTIRSGRDVPREELVVVLEDVVDALSGKAFDSDRVPGTDPLGPLLWGAHLVNERGMVKVTGSRPAVERCIELGRFQRPEVDDGQV